MRLSSEYEADVGRYDLERRPYWKAILDAFDDAEVQQIDVLKSTQVGGTLALIAAMLSRSVLAPAPAIVVTPDRESAVELRDRVYSNAEATPTIRDKVPLRRHRNTRAIDLHDCRVYLAWSQARQRLRGRACQVVYLTEIDVYGNHSKGGNAVRAAEQRVKSFRRHKIYAESSPSAHPSTIDQRYRDSLKYSWQCPCPHCGHYQDLRFFAHKRGEFTGKGGIRGMKNDRAQWLEPDEVRKQAWYECESGGCRIESDQIKPMVELGKWVAEGQFVDQETGEVSGEPVRGRRHIGFRLWSIHSDARTIGDIAAAYISALRDGTIPDFFGNWLAIAHRYNSERLEWGEIAKRRTAAYDRNIVPSDCWFLTSAADVQQDRVYWIVRGWGDQSQSWLIDWGINPRTPDTNDDLDALIKSVLDRRWVVDGLNPRGRDSLRVRLMAIDAGHRTRTVQEWTRARADERIRTVRGDHQLGFDRWRRSLVDRNARTGEVYQDGLDLWRINVYPIYHQMVELRAATEDGPTAWRLPRNIKEEGQDYLEQIANFERIISVDDNGAKVAKWEPRNGLIGCDYWDTEVYSRAMAEMIVASQKGNFGWDASHWPREIPKRARRTPQAGHSARPGGDGFSAR